MAHLDRHSCRSCRYPSLLGPGAESLELNYGATDIEKVLGRFGAKNYQESSGCLVSGIEDPLGSVYVPLHCFLGQHAVSREEGDAADDRQVLEGLEHVQVGPVDVHEAQQG